METQKYGSTISACFVGYIVQAIINNFAPLLFLTFQRSFSVPLEQITFLITINFSVQLTVDMLAVYVVDRIGYRASAVIAHITAAIGLASMAVLPYIMPPFVGLLCAVVVYAIGGGLLEVIISPIVEACPNDHKERTMSILHSFYCWGHMGVVIISTVFFAVFGIENWRILAFLWAMVPLFNVFVFMKVPIAPLIAENEEHMKLSELLKSGTFWLFMLVMACAGASEQAVSQWASAFAESGLKVSKTIGDLAGPMLFALLMGSARAIYGKFGDKIPLKKFMAASGVLCVISYAVIAFSPWSAVSFIGCAVCGFSVGIMWPGTFSLAAASPIKRGGTALFALLALAGDVGCGGGPTFVGLISNDLTGGIAAGMIFPIIFVLGIMFIKGNKAST